jgi:hypothetical protein
MVRPGTYTENVAMEHGVTVIAAATGRTYTTTIAGTVTLASTDVNVHKVAMIRGFDIYPPANSDAVVVTSTGAMVQLTVIDGGAYPGGTGRAAYLEVPRVSPTSGTPGLVADNFNFYRESGGVAAGNVIVKSGTLSMNRSPVRNGSSDGGDNISVSIEASTTLGGTNHGVVWAQEAEFYGPVSVNQTNAATRLVFSANNSQIRVLGASAVTGIFDNTNGDMAIGNTSILANPFQAGDVITSTNTTGTNGYSNIALYVPTHTIPAANTFGAAVRVGGQAYATTFNSTSDRNMKENFMQVDPMKVLDKVANLAVTEWNYKNDPSKRYVGPMAQDFHAAFGLGGTDDKTISVVNAQGVTLAALQGLNQKVDELQTRVVTLESALNVSRNVATGNLGIGMAIVGIPTLLIAAARRRKATKAD